MIYGADYLFGNHFQSVMLHNHPRGWAGGIFLHTAGYSMPTVEAICKSGKFSELVVHIAPFDKSHSYPIAELAPLVKKETKILEALAKKYPHTVLMPSPFCEHNHIGNAIYPLLQDMRKLAPTCDIVNSIWKGQPISGYITEIHLPDATLLPIPTGEFLVSFDGFGGNGEGDFPDCNIQKLLQHYRLARHIRWWNFRMNGKYGHLDNTPINQREDFPDAKYLRSQHAMMKEREGNLTWPNNALYKPMADDHGNEGVTKDNRAMCILPKGGQFVEVLDREGKVIDRMERFKPDHVNNPKGPRYYSKLCSYELGNLAKKNTGSRLIKIRSGGTTYPLTDADLRSGLFKG